MGKINEILEQLELNVIGLDQQSLNIAKQFYQGSVDKFHSYKDYASTTHSVDRERMTLGMAKVISEKWANLIWNPETVVEMGNESNQTWLDGLFERLNFTNNFNNLVELFFALGNGATVEYNDYQGKPQIDFVSAESIAPLKFTNNNISSCAFISEKVIDGNELIYIMIHEEQDNGLYRVRNLYYSNDDKPELVNVEGVLKEYYSPVKQFQIYKPAIANNINIGSPMGIALTNNTVDELKAVDISFDGLVNEVKEGQIKVYVSEEALQNKDGEMVYNSSQTKFYYLSANISATDDLGNNTSAPQPFIHVSTPNLRPVLIDFLSTQLNLLGRASGLGDNAFSFKDGSIYTNTTQVISTNSDLYNTRRKHCSIVEHGIKELIKACYHLEFGRDLEDTISIQFDDSIIHDEKEDDSRWLSLLNLGYINVVTFFEKTMNMTRAEAQAFHEEQLDGIPEEVEME